MKPGRTFAGFAIVAAVALLALVSLAWTPQPPSQMHIGLRLRPPLAAGLFGTDPFGRDVLSMLMAGAWTSLSIGVPAVALGALFGTLAGMSVAIQRGVVEAVIMRAADVIFAVPPILSALMLAGWLGPGRGSAVAAIAIFTVPVFARVARAAALQVWSRDYISAARASGKSAPRIALEHVLPNIASQLVVQVSLQLGLAILTEAGLSYLGLGAPPPTPSWGRMLADAQTYLRPAPWLVLVPGCAVALAVLGFNLLGDGLRDRLDRRGAPRP